jgi:hypothetical protein
MVLLPVVDFLVVDAVVLIVLVMFDLFSDPIVVLVVVWMVLSALLMTDFV